MRSERCDIEVAPAPANVTVSVPAFVAVYWTEAWPVESVVTELLDKPSFSELSTVIATPWIGLPLESVATTVSAGVAPNEKVVAPE